MLIPLQAPKHTTEVRKRLYNEGLLFDPIALNTDRRENQKQRVERAAKLRMKGYQLNSFPNRRSRRQSAKDAGYLKRDKDGNNSWGAYRAPNNVQTVHKIDLQERV